MEGRDMTRRTYCRRHIDLAGNEDENIFIAQSSFQKYEDKGTYFIILCFTLHRRLGQRPPFLCNLGKKSLIFQLVFLNFTDIASIVL
jgi:hypothetical protein